MSWVNKALEKHKKEVLFEQFFKECMNSPYAKEKQREFEEQAVLEAYRRLAFIICEYMELNFNCKKQGLTKVLKFLHGKMTEIGEDNDYFVAVDKYYKEELGLDVLSAIGIKIVADKESE